jgi:hypothetical protein
MEQLLLHSKTVQRRYANLQDEVSRAGVRVGEAD